MKLLFSVVTLPVIIGCFILLLYQKRVEHIKREDLILISSFLLIVTLSYIIQSTAFFKGIRTKDMFQSRIIQLFIIFILSTILFLLLPEIIFDDAAIVLRYMDNFGKGLFFQYNATDPPVYGISGFVHGLLAGLLCYFHLASSENALTFSNYIGFIFASAFIYLIYCRIIGNLFFSFLAWAITLITARSFLLVAASGLETSLHLAIVLAAVYYFLVAQKKAFYFFSALMIISKLDAVPVAMILLVYHFAASFSIFRFKKSMFYELRIFAIFFMLPLVAGLAGIGLLFGSPLPQSAFAKLYYHPHPKDTWFPFLQYFTGNYLKLFTLLSGLLFWLAAILEAASKRRFQMLENTLFGSLFIGVMCLFFFYNPLEQMIWYYAMPELFLIMQVIYGCYYFLTNYSLVQTKWTSHLIFFFLVCFGAVFWIDVSKSFSAMEENTAVVESERKAIGKYIGEISSRNDTLLSSHGLPTRFFKGYVIDLSGLNSKLATQYKLKPDSIIDKFRPNFIINHAYPIIEKIFDRRNYRVSGVYHNITLGNNFHSWILLKRGPADSIFKVKFLDTLLNKERYVFEGVILKMKSKEGILVIRDTVNADSKKLHFGVTRDQYNAPLFINMFRKGVLLRSSVLNIAKFSTSFSKVNHIQLNISGVDSVALRLGEGKSFFIVEPIFEVGFRGQEQSTFLSKVK